MTSLDAVLTDLKTSGQKALVPYLVAGLDDGWVDCVRAAAHAGADAIEVGVPFSDPVMDGPVIAAAAQVSLGRGTTLASVMDELATVQVSIPLLVMTYYNIFHHNGLERTARQLRASGVSGVIVPDLALEECGPWHDAATTDDLATVLMVAPSTPPARAARLAAASQGFVYAAARMAVTGESHDLGDAERVVSVIRETSTAPVYVGIGISNTEQAHDAATFADGVIVGTALVRRLLDGEGARGTEAFVRSMRDATR